MCLKAISLFIMHKLFFPSRVSRRSCSYDSVPLPWLFSLFVAKWTFMLTLKTTLRVKSSSLSMCCSRGNKIIFRPAVCGIFGKERLMSLRFCTHHRLFVLWEKLNFSLQNDCWLCGNAQNNPQNFFCFGTNMHK